jgi:hypothetical protein
MITAIGGIASAAADITTATVTEYRDRCRVAEADHQRLASQGV